MNLRLKKKLHYFFNSHHRGREGMRQALNKLREHGRLALVGGMLRDIALFGNLEFKSDLDFVIDPVDLQSFEKHMIAFGARSNRFGGYSLPVNWGDSWKIDIWPLERTWAHVEGHAVVKNFADLVNATFFNCDAIIYDIGVGKLGAGKLVFASEYFQHLDRRILEINLQPNPNPMGNAVRAFRYALVKGFCWGPKLSRFLEDRISPDGWDAMIESEKRSFQFRHLEKVKIEELRRALSIHVLTGASTPFNVTAFQRNVQLNLPISNNANAECSIK